ncbi:MAG: hypothetical protein FWC30_00900 [Candidatus Bathyarchaeota archaeon]|nr:hypothetical protein [Candidatus Termiticorpusculum sp.]
MVTKSMAKFKVRHKKVVLITLLLFVILFLSIFVYKSSINGGGSEVALRAAINDAPSNVPTTIVLDRDIFLTGSALEIPGDKNIILVSDKVEGFWRLVGASNQTTISVNGTLTLESVIVTHNSGNYGSGVTVNSTGTLVLSGGEICNNTVEFIGLPDGNTLGENGGGVRNLGNFSMVDGVIANNAAVGVGGGGGVLNVGNFSMIGGVIANNTAAINGGGVYTSGSLYASECSFSMVGGEISGNVANFYGGGVYNWFSKVSLCGGMISNNDAGMSGGGVYNFYGVFDMSSGVISNNIAKDKGGGVYSYFYSSFSLSGSGVISNNTAANLGGGVCIDGVFDMRGGVISGNAAVYGGGVYVGNGVFNVTGGKVSSNTSRFGDEIWIDV